MYTKDNRYEIPDPTPVEIPLGYKAPERLEDMIARMIRTENMMVLREKGIETFEEADDFDVDDEDNMTSEYQMSEMQEERPRDVERTEERKSEDVSRNRRATDSQSAGKEESEVESVGKSEAVAEKAKGTVGT